MFYLIAGIIVIIGLEILRDWLIYKHRGKVQPDDPKDENPPVITGPSDAHAQKLIDQYNKEKSKKNNLV